MPIIVNDVQQAPTIRNLSVNGVSIQTLAWNVTQRGARWRVPGRRGDNQPLPGLHGTNYLAGKTYDENTLVLNMWVIGANPDGSMPSSLNRVRQVEQHADMLTALFSSETQLVLTQTRPDGDRVLTGEVKSAIDFTTMAGATRAEFSVEIVAADPFWYSPETTSQTAQALTSGFYSMSAFADCTAPINKGTYTLSGPIQSPTLLNPTTGQFLSLADSVAAGEQWVVDNQQWSSRVVNATTHASRNVIAATAHAGGASLLDLSPDMINGPRVGVLGSGQTSQTALQVAARKAYLIA